MFLQHDGRLETKQPLDWHPGHPNNGASAAVKEKKSNGGRTDNIRKPETAERQNNPDSVAASHAASATAEYIQEQKTSDGPSENSAPQERAQISPPIGGRMQRELKELVEELQNLCDKPDGWVKIGREGTLNLFNRPTNKMPCFKGEGVMKFPLALIVNFLKDRSMQHLWDDMYEESRDVETCGPQTKIEYFRCKPLWPSQARDFCNLSHWRSWDGGKQAITCSVSAQHNMCPEYPGFTRGEIGPSGWTLREFTDEDGCVATRVNYVGQVDVKVAMPAWVVKSVTAKQGKLVLKIDACLCKLSSAQKEAYLAQDLSNYWDDTMPVAQAPRGSGAGGESGGGPVVAEGEAAGPESPNQSSSAWIVKRLDIKRWYITPQRNNYRKRLAWGKEVCVSTLQPEDCLMFSVQSEQGQLFDFEVGLRDVDTDLDLWVPGQARGAESADASDMQMRVKLRVSMVDDVEQHIDGCGKWCGKHVRMLLLWLLMTASLLFAGLFMFPSYHFFNWFAPHLPLSTISLWAILCACYYNRNFNILRTDGFRPESLFVTPLEIRLSEDGSPPLT